jgi:type I restriction enzyme, S subunit
MTLNLNKSAWKQVALGDVVRHVTDRVDPETSGLERFLAGEHIPSQSLEIRDWGIIGRDPVGPMFYKRFKPGHVLYVSRRAYLRKTAVPDFTGICGEKTFVLETINPGILLQEFLPFLLSAERFHAYAVAMSRGSVNPYINWTELAAYKFDLPSLAEQRRIGELMWAAGRHSKQVRILSQRVISAHETWVTSQLASQPTVPLGQVVRLQNGRPVPSELYRDEGIPLLRPGDMKENGETRWTKSSVRIPADFAEENPSWIIAPGDLVINMTAQSLDDRFLGRVCRLHDIAFLNQRIGRLIPSCEISSDYLHVALRAPGFSDWVARKSEGSKVKHMHWRHVENYPLPLPDIARQLRIAEESAELSSASVAIGDETKAITAFSSAVSSEVFGGST